LQESWRWYDYVFSFCTEATTCGRGIEAKPKHEQRGRRWPVMSGSSGGFHVPDVQLGPGYLPLRPRGRNGGVRGGVLPRPGAALPLPPPVRADAPGLPAAGMAQGLRVGADHSAHSHVLAEGRRRHAAGRGSGGLGDGICHHLWRLLRLLHPPGQDCPGGGRAPLDEAMSLVSLSFARSKESSYCVVDYYYVKIIMCPVRRAEPIYTLFIDTISISSSSTAMLYAVSAPCPEKLDVFCLHLL
jgi:hypothetical protein